MARVDASGSQPGEASALLSPRDGAVSDSVVYDLERASLMRALRGCNDPGD
jgi:hypothetical protein